MPSYISSERIDPQLWSKDKVQYLLYLRHLFSYNFFKSYCIPSTIGLDYGCGDGYGCFILADFVKEMHGADINEETIERASLKYKKDNIFFHLIDDNNLQFQENTFDIVISSQVIEHLKDPLIYLKNAWRVLKPGGLLLLTTPNRNIRLRDGQCPWNRFHITEYSQQTLERLLGKVFGETKILGVFASQEITDLEIKRIKRRIMFNSLDFLKVRKLLSPTFEYQLLGVLRKLKNSLLGESKKDTMHNFSIKDYYTDTKNLEKSLDLVAVSKK